MQQQDQRDEPRPTNDTRKRTRVEPAKAPVEKKPSLGERWRAMQPTKSTLFWTVIAAVILTIVVGFMWGGWVTAGSSEKAGVAVGKDEVILRLAPICVAQAGEDPDISAKLVELEALSHYDRTKYVQDQGWATMPGEEKPDRKVAEACLALLLETTP
ncbi:MAG: hypothetical protein QM346_18475 [Chloroflexota bacterium]|nr:hypothetical protein [Chloroflexota bacterium]